MMLKLEDANVFKKHDKQQFIPDVMIKVDTVECQLSEGSYDSRNF